MTDFLPGEGWDGYEVQHFDSDTCGVGCATAPADATVAQVRGPPSRLNAAPNNDSGPANLRAALPN